MMKSISIIVLIIALAISVNAQMHSLSSQKATKKEISSIRYTGDSLAINQMVILTNKNLEPFIHNIRVSKMNLFKNKEGTPVFIKSFLQSFSHDKFDLANPGENWNCCDDGHDDKLPNRKIICQGNDGHLFLISYLSGGVGEINHLILIRYNGTTITDFWTGTLWKNLTRKRDIANYLNNNKNKRYGLNTNVIFI